tara:strand:- start:196 stop:891 length:696 start_codon:yes stop_codon:yes gene_type:complete
MAAVIGSRDNYNRDPNKMGKFYVSGFGGMPIIPYSNNSLTQGAANAFHSTNYWTSINSTGVTANTARTIYSVSGNSGFLISAFSQMGNTNSMNASVTFVVTIDGVATTLALGASGTTGYPAGWLGTPAGIRRGTPTVSAQNTPIIANDHLGPLGASSSNVNIIGNKVVTYAQGDNSNQGQVLLPTLSWPTTNPLACLRFENSLTITVAANFTTVNLATVYKGSGCLVRLDT